MKKLVKNLLNRVRKMLVALTVHRFNLIIEVKDERMTPKKVCGKMDKKFTY